MAKKVAVAQRVEGDVRLTSDENSFNNEPMRGGNQIFDGDKIITSNNGYCAILHIESKQIQKIRSNQVIVIKSDKTHAEEMEESNDDSVEFWHNNSAFKVVQPTWVASVKG